MSIAATPFDWVLIHWWSGVGLIVTILFHLWRVAALQGPTAMIPGADEVREFGRDLRGADLEGLSAAKQNAFQKSYHLAASLTVLTLIGTGIVNRFAEALGEVYTALGAGLGVDTSVAFKDRVRNDTATARAVIGLLLVQSSNSLDMTDNTNELIALRSFLTDLFFIDQSVLPPR